MAETVTLLEHRVRQVVERLRSLDAERERLTRELDGLRAGEHGRQQVVAEAARALDGLARELSEDLREDA